MTNLPALHLLLQGYLGFDWPDDYANAVQAVDDFLRGEPAMAQLLPEEIQRLLVGAETDSELHQVVEGLGSGYLPEADGITLRDWLLDVLERARADQGAE